MHMLFKVSQVWWPGKTTMQQGSHYFANEEIWLCINNLNGHFENFIKVSVRLCYIISWEPEGCYCCSMMFHWEPEGCYHYSKMFHWEPEGCYHYSKMFHWEPEGVLSLFKDVPLITRRAFSPWYTCTAIAPLWFPTEHRGAALTNFWFLTEHCWIVFTPFCLSTTILHIQDSTINLLTRVPTISRAGVYGKWVWYQNQSLSNEFNSRC